MSNGSRVRLVALLDALRARLRHCTENEALHSSVDNTSVEDAIQHLVQLGYPVEAARLRSLHDEFFHAVTDVGLADAAPQEEREEWVALFGSFPDPNSMGSVDARRLVALGVASQMDKWLGDLAGHLKGEEQVDDGPEPPNLFFWKGCRLEIPPKQWRILAYLWDTRTADEDDVMEHVWGHSFRVEQGTFKSAVSVLNRLLAEHAIPISVSRKSGSVVLTVDCE